MNNKVFVWLVGLSFVVAIVGAIYTSDTVQSFISNREKKPKVQLKLRKDTLYEDVKKLIELEIRSVQSSDINVRLREYEKTKEYQVWQDYRSDMIIKYSQNLVAFNEMYEKQIREILRQYEREGKRSPFERPGYRVEYEMLLYDFE